MSDINKQVEIAFVTTADPAGAEQEIRIIDTVKAKAKVSNEEFVAWQAKLKADRMGRSSALATELTMESDLAERAARREAARISNEAAAAEASEIRMAQQAAADEKALVKEATARAARAKADFEELVAAREKLALEEARGERILKSAALQLGLRETGIPGARVARSVLMNEGALAQLGGLAAASGPFIAIAAAAASMGVAMHNASKAADELIEETKKLGIDTSELERAAHPIKAVFSDMWSGIKTAADEAGNALTLGASHAAKAAAEEGLAHAKVAVEMKNRLEEAKKLHAEEQAWMTAYSKGRGYQLEALDLERVSQALRENAELRKAKESLDVNRAKRAGASEGDIAIMGFGQTEADKEKELQDAEIALKKAQQEAAKARDEARDASGSNKASADLAASAAEDKLELAAQAWHALRARIPVEIADEAEKTLDIVTKDTADTDKLIAEKLIEQINQVKQAQGGALSAKNEQILEQAQQLERSVTGSAAEQKKLTDLWEQFRQSNEAGAQAAQKAAWDAIRMISDSHAKWLSIQHEIDTMKNQMESFMKLNRR